MKYSQPNSTLVIQIKPTLFFILMVAMILLQNCEETTEWTLTPGQNGQLVVEAILTDETIKQRILLSQSFDGLNIAAPPITDAIVQVTANNVVYDFIPAPGSPGLYLSEFPFAVFSNLEYILTIRWQNVRYEASSFLSPVAPLQRITFDRLIENNDSLFIKELPFIFNPNQQAMYEINVDWSHLPPIPDALNRAKIVFYTFKTFDENGLFRPIRDTLFFPEGSQVTIKKFGLNDDFANHLRALAIETEWNSSLFFYSSSANIPTNISNGGLGFFSTCAVEVDTLIAK